MNQTKEHNSKNLGLYNPLMEHDSCGVGFIGTRTNQPTRDIVQWGLEGLEKMEHRGATGADENTGDGAGIMTNIPWDFLNKFYNFPKDRLNAVGNCFYQNQKQLDQFSKLASHQGFEIIGIRKLPINPTILGVASKKALPKISQIALTSKKKITNHLEFDRQLYTLRKFAEEQINLYFCSLNSRTIVYKGMLTTYQLRKFYADLEDPDFTSKFALFHSRFSTNTFPDWKLAHPYRFIAHNGEINTIQGNRNWFNARFQTFATDKIPQFKKIKNLLTPHLSDSGTFDEALELFYYTGRSIEHVVSLMVPPAWENLSKSGLKVDPEIEAFYQYNATLLESWDGPAALYFCDGDTLGATLDRNGFRPSRYWITNDLVVMSSETGILSEHIEDKKIIQKGKLGPGEIFKLDLNTGKIQTNFEVRKNLAKLHPYQKWNQGNTIYLSNLPLRESIMTPHLSVQRRQKMFGYTEEDLKLLLGPMAETGSEPIGAMGTDTPIPVLSNFKKPLFNYFQQNFAQVTNPPLDSIREKIVTSVESVIGPEPNQLVDQKDHSIKLSLPYPILSNDDLAKIRGIDEDKLYSKHFKGHVIAGLYPIKDGVKGLEKRINEIYDEVDLKLKLGYNIFLLSDRNTNQELAPIPSLLLLSAIQHHLVYKGTRSQCSIIVECGDVKETHDCALLIAYGAAAINPYLAFETVEDLSREGLLKVDTNQATQNLIQAFSKGILKIMSKMGISTIMSYRGSQIFEAIGLNHDLIHKYFYGTISRIEGIGLDEIVQGIEFRHNIAYPEKSSARLLTELPTGGDYKWRKKGEKHLWNPETLSYLRIALEKQREKKFDEAQELFDQYSKLINDQSKNLMTLRGLFKLQSNKKPIPLDQVEPIENIFKRFTSGAMSYGSISQEAHETIAKAMNKIHARSNSGEGGESSERSQNPKINSKIKQVASGRFGVNINYLNSATDIQIKIVQGAKPGEGGHLPGGKVYPWIAKVRNSTPGIELVSPPPHHDIYSIEDLKQLIHDLKMANPEARINVKLGSEFGVGTVAAGVVKAKADVVLISGFDGGTGAAPLSSIKHAGTPWEIGLSETNQILVNNNLRSRVKLQTDGQLKTARDVVIAAILGADEFGFATTLLVSMGCIMMRVCNKNTCPVGIATQNPTLRKKFQGNSDDVVNFLTFIAADVRKILAQLGYHSLEEIIGQNSLLKTNKAINYYKTQGLNLQPILQSTSQRGVYDSNITQDHKIKESLDYEILQQAKISNPKKDSDFIKKLNALKKIPIDNTKVTVGTLIGHHIARKYQSTLKDDAIKLSFQGIAGQSFGSFAPQGLSLFLEGEGNDYVAKGLSGGQVVISATAKFKSIAHQNIIAGNVVAFGATKGKLYLNGIVGERFGVRNSGALIVCEGCGDHGLEYMTGGVALILGPTGINLGSGFAGGEAFIYKLDPTKINSDQKSKLNIFNLAQSSQKSNKSVLKKILSDYYKKSNSYLAKKILDNFDQELKNFSYLIPKNFQAIQKILVTKQNENEKWNEILEVVNG